MTKRIEHEYDHNSIDNIMLPQTHHGLEWRTKQIQMNTNTNTNKNTKTLDIVNVLIVLYRPLAQKQNEYEYFEYKYKKNCTGSTQYHAEIYDDTQKAQNVNDY